MSWQVGEYRTEGDKPFDQGSFGTVWRARRVTDGTPVALKLVLLLDTPDAREKIAAERHGAMLQQRFEQAHGMVPRVFDFGHDADGNLFIAMELIAGGSLADVIKNGPIDPRLAAQYAMRVCEFLDKAHCFATTVEGEPYDRLVHADLKPGHILIDSAGAVKVLDFGIAKALAKTTQVTTNNWGTSAYASPERLDCGHVNEHVDFWSLGVILYEMMCGHRPYPGLDRNRSQLEAAIRSNAPRDPLPASCPAGLAAIVAKLLAYQIERRYSSAAAIRADLQRFLAGEQPAAVGDYVTPATMAIGTAAAASRRMPQMVLDPIPPTDPLPMPGTPALAGQSAPAAAMAVPSARPRTAPGLLQRALWLFVLLVLLGVVASEGVAWVAAERFRDGLHRLDGGSLSERREDYERIVGLSLFDTGVRLRVNERLAMRLASLADAVIADYRREDPTMGSAEWRQAQDAMRWAMRMSPANSRLFAKLLLCEGHVIRLSARTQSPAAARQAYRRAVEKFEAAARLDPRSYDPYLAISLLAVYGAGDIGEAQAAIEEAVKRGHVAGRRERAVVGDGYLKRANSSRTLARSLSGDQRRRELERARDDYKRCVEAFDPIVGFGRSAFNMESCKRQAERIDRELALMEGSSWWEH
jgi:hypothetical protein